MRDIVDAVSRRMQEDIGFLLAPDSRRLLQSEESGHGH